MSALSTPGGGGTTAQTKPTSGKQKFQKLDINSLYCANKNENSEPSSVKSQQSRKHGMQSLGKVPSARRPPANLPSLKTETGQDPNANPISAATTTVSTPATCSSQTTTTASNSSVVAGTGLGGWVALPPPSSPHFRTEFPSLEAAAQPSHRSSDHSTPQPQLRPQTEGSWTCGGTAGVRQEAASTPAAAPASTPASQQTPAFRAILPPFLMKGSNGSGLGLGTLGTLRDNRGGVAGAPGAAGTNVAGPRAAPRPPPTPRAVEVLTARPILRDEQISSLDDISRDAGWAQNDDIDYNQKLDFSDGESSAPNKNNKNSRASIETERVESKIQEPGDEDQMWAERRQKHNNEVAQVTARARLLKEEGQRRQMRDSTLQSSKDSRDRNERGDRDRLDNREKEIDTREKERMDNRERERSDNRDRDRMDIREKERGDIRDRELKDKDRTENRDRNDNRDRFDRDRDIRERDRDRIESRDRGGGRADNRERQENDKERTDNRDRDRNDNRDRGDRIDRDRFERDRERGDRDRERDRDRDRMERDRNDRNERDREFRDRDRERDYGRERDQSNPAFSKNFHANMPPRFLKQHQNRQQEEPHKAWAFTNKSAPRRQEPPAYNAPRHAAHNGRRSYSRDYSDREDEFRREKDGPGPQWRSEMQDYDRPGRDLDRSNSKDSYGDRRNESDRKSDVQSAIENSNRTAADKLTEVFERKSIGLTESSDSSIPTQAPERRNSPPSNASQRESSEREFGKASWAEVTQDESSNFGAISTENTISSKEKDQPTKEPINHPVAENESAKLAPLPQQTLSTQQQPLQQLSQQQPQQQAGSVTSNAGVSLQLNQVHKYHNNHPPTNFINTPQVSQATAYGNIQSQSVPATPIQSQSSFSDSTQSLAKPNQPVSKPSNSNESLINSQIQKPASADQSSTEKTMFALKPTKELSESESAASKSSGDPLGSAGAKGGDAPSAESHHANADSQKRNDDKRNDRFGNEQNNKTSGKEPIERKSSGSGSEKKGRGYGGVGGYAVYNRVWGPRESRGRRPHRSSRSNNRASESDGSADGAPGERRERRGPPATDGLENREPFAPRGQPSRRGRGGFQGTSRPPAPAKRVTGYGPPNTKSPFSQANRAVKENEEPNRDLTLIDDKNKTNNKPRTGSSTGRGRDRRPKGAGGPLSGEDENWETTSEHSEGGSNAGRRRSVGGRQVSQSQKNQGGRNQNSGNRQNNGRSQANKKDNLGDIKSTDNTEAMTDLKLSSTTKKDDDAVDDGFQEVRTKKNSKDARGPQTKEDTQQTKQPRSHSNQGGGRNGSSSRNPAEKTNSRGPAPPVGKSGPQYDRPRQTNLAPRFVKQRQKQMSMVTGFGPDTGAAPPPPPVNAWDKPISQTLRGNVEEPAEVAEANKSAPSSQRSTPAEALPEAKPIPPTTCALTSDKAGVLDGTTPPVETIIFENTNYKTAPPAEALKQKYQPSANTAKPQGEEITSDLESRALPFNGEVRPRPRSIQELIGDNGRPAGDADGSLGIQMSFDTSQKTEDSSDMKLDFAFDSDLGQLTEEKSAKTLGLPRGVHMSTSNTISPLTADLNLKIASVKKVWEMPAVAEGTEELQFAGFEENNTETGAPPNVCKVKPTQQLQSPPPQHYNHVGYQSGYGGLSVPSPPAVLFNSSQQLLGSSQQLPQQGSLYGAFLDQSRGQFGGFPGTPYGAGSAAPYNYQPPPDMFQSLPSQYRMAAAGGGAAFGQSGQLGNNPSTVLISSTSNSLMSATVKPSTQQIGAIGSKGGGVGGVGGVNTYQQQYLGYSGPVGEAPYSLPGLLPRPAPTASSYYSPYQPQPAPAPTYPLQFTQPAQSGAFGSQFLSSQLQVAAAVQQMQQQQYRTPMQQQYAPPQPRPPPQQQLKSPLHEHANGFAPLCESASPTPKGAAKPKPAHSPPQHKYHAHHPPPPALTPHAPHSQHVQHAQHAQHSQHSQHSQHAQHAPHQHHQHQQQQMVGNNGRCGGQQGSSMGRAGLPPPRYPAPIQRPHAPALPMYRAPPAPGPAQGRAPHHAGPPRHNLYYHHQQRNGAGGGERAPDAGEPATVADEAAEPVPAPDVVPPTAEVKAE